MRRASNHPRLRFQNDKKHTRPKLISACPQIRCECMAVFATDIIAMDTGRMRSL